MNRRKAKSSVDEDKLHEVDEQWFWGNVRGGGGAPLKDKQGNALANLKGVLNGAVEVDYSVSPGKRTHNNNYDVDNGRYNEPRVPDVQLNQQSFSNQHRSIRERNGYGNGRGPISSKASREDEYERFIPGLSDVPSHQRQPNKKNNAYQVPLSARRDDSSAVDAAIRMDGPPSPAAALRDNNYRRQQEGYQQDASPKKFMGALRELTSGQTDGDRNDKLKKQQAYQAMLKAQIEEKERKKQKEKEQEDAIKRKELVEYYRSINKPVPLELLSPQRKHNQPQGQEQFGGSGHRYHQDAFGDRYPDDNDSFQSRNDNMNYDYHNIPTKKNHPRNGDYDMNRGHNQYNDDDYQPMRRERNGNNPDSDKFVTVQEYDKLSRLCDKLLNQQEQLHSEIRKQADIIEDLKQKDNGKKNRNPKTFKAGIGQKQNGRVRANVYDDDIRDSEASAANRFSSAAQREKPYPRNRDQMYDRGDSRDASIDEDIKQRRFSLPRRAVSFDAGDSPNRVKIVDLGPRNDSKDEVDNFSDDEENNVGRMRKLNLPQRPSSMYEVGSPRRRLGTITSNTGSEDADSPREVAQSSRGRREARLNKKNPPVVKKPAPKKTPKVAFGGAIKPTKSRIDLNKPKPTKTKAAVDAVSAAVGMNKGRRNEAGNDIFNRNRTGNDKNRKPVKESRNDFQGGNRHSSIKKTALNIVNNNHPAHDKDPGDGGFGGFAKLQQSIKGGPIVAIHEEESHNSYKRDAPQGASMELRGQSEYFSVADDADVLGGDQLDRLLVQARNAR